MARRRIARGTSKASCGWQSGLRRHTSAQYGISFHPFIEGGNQPVKCVHAANQSKDRAHVKGAIPGHGAPDPDPTGLPSLSSVVVELDRDCPVLGLFSFANRVHSGLKVIFNLASHPDRVTLDLSLQLGAPVPHDLDNLPGEFW